MLEKTSRILIEFALTFESVGVNGVSNWEI